MWCSHVLFKLNLNTFYELGLWYFPVAENIVKAQERYYLLQNAYTIFLDDLDIELPDFRNTKTTSSYNAYKKPPPANLPAGVYLTKYQLEMHI